MSVLHVGQLIVCIFHLQVTLPRENRDSYRGADENQRLEYVVVFAGK
jgi:hypothetical protein